MADWPAEIETPPAIKAATQQADGTIRNNGGGSTVTIHYKLRAHRTFDSTWQYWVDTAIQFTNAPGGAGEYDLTSLMVEGTF